MAEDARFEDGGERPLRLKALDSDDLNIVASLVQDAVFPASEMKWDQHARRFALLLNRFRWENKTAAELRNRGFERVQTVLAVEDVQSIASQGVERSDMDTIHSLLTLEFEPADDGAGMLVLTLAGNGAIRVAVETLEVTLTDVTRPYTAPSGKAPAHAG